MDVFIEGFSFSRNSKVTTTKADLIFGSKDEWTYRVAKNENSILDAFVTLVSRANGSNESIDAACFCYYMDTVQFFPGKEVKMETTGTGDIHIRYLVAPKAVEKDFFLNGFVIYKNIDVSYIKRTNSNVVFRNRTDSSMWRTNYFVQLIDTGDLNCSTILIHSVNTHSSRNVQIGEEIQISKSGTNNMEAYVCFVEKDLEGRKQRKLAPRVSIESKNSICGDLNKFFRSDDSSGDFKLVAEDGRFQLTYKLLLKSRTSLIEKVGQEATEFHFKDHSIDTIKNLTHFLMFDELPNECSNHLELYMVACDMNVLSLIDMCQEQLKDLIVTRRNVDLVMEVALKYKCPELLEAVAKYQEQEADHSFDAPTSLAQDIATINLNEGDIVLISSDKKKIPVYSFLLKSRSIIFKKLLDLELKTQEGSKSELTVPNFTGEVIEDFVQFLATDKVSRMESHAIDLLLMADKYSVSKLGIDCINYICDNLKQFDHFELMKVSRKVRSHKLSNSIGKLQSEGLSFFKI